MESSLNLKISTCKADRDIYKKLKIKFQALLFICQSKLRAYLKNKGNVYRL